LKAAAGNNNMLKELKHVSQIPGEPRRRWFADDYFDLIVWYDEKNELSGFQLCYNKEKDERAFTWKRHSTYTHHRVDDGETKPQRKATPILVTDGVFDYKAVADRFQQEGKNIEKTVYEFVLGKILQYESSSGRLTSSSPMTTASM
jgi:hypothetical protein